MPVLETSSITQQVYRAILRHIRKHELSEGDRLPTQEQWLRKLNCGTIPLNRAMQMLTSHGVVQRRPKTGTVLLRTAPEHPVNWSIGVLMPKLPILSASYPALFQFLQIHLQAAEAQVRPYYLNQQLRMKDYHQLDDFDGLPDDIESGRLDGILNLLDLTPVERRRLSDLGLVHCKLMAWDPRAAGMVVDLPEMVRQAVRLLKDKGSERIALLGGINHSWREVSGGTLWEPFEQAVAPNPPLEFYEYGNAPAGRVVGRRLLDLPEQERPDGLVCVWDDYFALGLTEVLREDSSYRPAITALTSQQASLPFFLPVYRYELDLREMAQKGVQLLLRQLQCAGQAPLSGRVVPTLNEPEPTTLPRQMLAPNQRAMIASEGARRMLHEMYEQELSALRPRSTREDAHVH